MNANTVKPVVLGAASLITGFVTMNALQSGVAKVLPNLGSIRVDLPRKEKIIKIATIVSITLASALVTSIVTHTVIGALDKAWVTTPEVEVV